MYLFASIWALVAITCGVFGDAVPDVATEAPPTINPYFANRNPLIPGYNPFYNTNNPYYNTNNPYYNANNPNHNGKYNYNTAQVPILSYSSSQGADGSYSFSYSTGDGKQAQEAGFLKDAYIDNAGAPQGTQVKEGSFSYISPEGTPIAVNYVADENGFRPGNIHISTDGRGALPAPVIDGAKRSQIYDPRYNLYDPYNRNNVFGQYNNFKQYDPRYPYDPRYDLYNPYRTGAFNKVVKEEVKKETA